MRKAAEVGMRRKIIVHYHIFKNAGSSVTAALKSSFGPSFGSLHGPNPWSIVESSQLRQYLLDNPGVRAITSHHFRAPLPEAPSFEAYPIIFLRHPIDRIGSVYEFEKRSHDEGIGRQVAKKTTFSEYVNWRLSSEYALPIRDFQVTYLSSVQIGRPDTLRVRPEREHLEEAKRFLSSLPCFGLVEEYGESVDILERFLTPHFPEFHFAREKHNVSDNRAGHIEDRLDQIKASLEASLYQRLLDENTLDMELYDWAVKTFRAFDSFSTHG